MKCTKNHLGCRGETEKAIQTTRGRKGAQLEEFGSGGWSVDGVMPCCSLGVGQGMLVDDMV